MAGEKKVWVFSKEYQEIIIKKNQEGEVKYMLIDIFDISAAYTAMSAFAILGTGAKLLLSSIYKRDIRNVRSIEHTKKRWLKRMRRNFEKTFGDGLDRDAQLFVESELSNRQVFGFSLRELDEIINQLPLLMLTLTVFFDFMLVNERIPAIDVVSFTLYGVSMSLLIHTVNMMVDNRSKAGNLRILLTNYFNNEKLPLLMTGAGEEKRLPERSVMRETGLVAVALDSQEEEEEEKPMSLRATRKHLKAEKLRLRRLAKQQQAEERMKRKKAREEMKQQAMKLAYEEKMKKLQEKYKPVNEKGTTPVPVMVGVEGWEEIKHAPAEKNMHRKNAEAVKETQAPKKDRLDQTLNEAFPETKVGKDDEKLIEEVLKEYLFR